MTAGVIWSAVRATVSAFLGVCGQFWSHDPKQMELSSGRDRFIRYADRAAGMARLLEDAVTEMHERAPTELRRTTRTFMPPLAFAFFVVRTDDRVPGRLPA